MRRAGRILLKIVMTLAGLAAALAGGLYLWLGTEAGARTLFGRLKDLAASEGLAISARSVKGPLPRRLKAEGLRIEDGRGLLFLAETLEAELKPGALLEGLIHLTQVRLDEPVFVPSPPGDDQAAGGPFPNLPFGLRLDELSVTRGRLETEEFKVGGLGLSGRGAWISGPAGVELSGDMALQAENSPGGPLNLKGNWRLWPPSGAESGRLVLEGLDLQAAGLALAGGLTIEFKDGEPGLSGRLAGEDPDWKALAQWSGLDIQGGAARLALDLDSTKGQKADLKVELDSLTFGPPADPELALAQIRASLTADDLFGRRDLGLTLSLGPGAAAGLAWAEGQITAGARGGQGTWSLDFSALSGRADAEPSGRDHMTANGGFDLAGSAAEVARLELKAGAAGLKLAAPVALSWAEGLKVSPVKARILPAGELSLAAKVGSGEMDIKAEITKLPYRFLDLFAKADLPEGQIQRLTLDLGRRGQAYSGGFSLKTSLDSGTLGRLTPELDLDGRLEGQALVAKGALSGGPGWPAAGKIDFRLPLSPGREGAPPQPDREGALSGRLDFSGPLEPLWGLAKFYERTLTGQTRMEISLDGSLSRPLLTGSLRLTGGRYEDKVLGIWLRDLNLSAESRPDQAIQLTMTGRDLGRGEMSLAGEIRDLASPSLKAEGRLKSFKPLRRDDLSLTLSGGLGLAGPLDRLTVTSDLTLEEGDLNLNLLPGSGSIATLPLSDPAEAAAPSADSALDLDLRLNLPGRFRAAGYGVESEWRGRFQVKGPPGHGLAIIGELDSLRGWYEPPVFNKQFNFERGKVTFTGGPIPFLDLEMINQGPELTAIIKIDGPAHKPRIKLTSRPPMSQDEVAGRLLFGKGPSSISRLEALQLAAALRDLTSFGGDSLNPLKTVQSSLGLDVLRLGGSTGQRERQVSDLSGSMAKNLKKRDGGGARTDNATVAVEAGKYISDNIYMGVEHGGRGPAVRLEVELSRSISLETRSSPESSQVGLGWKKDY